MKNAQGQEVPELSETERVAFYGAMFAMAAADGMMDKDEINAIFGVIELDGLSTASSDRVKGYLLHPPKLDDVLVELRSASDAIRFATMIQLVEVALANDVIEESEKAMLERARIELRVTAEQLEAIEKLVRDLYKLRRDGVPEDQWADRLKGAFSGLAAVGVPLAAVYFCGVVGFSAVGIVTGLAALGLGFGMVPGIGVAVLLGTATFCGARYLLNRGTESRKQSANDDKERRVRRVIKNMQDVMNRLVTEVQALASSADLAEQNRAMIEQLKQRIRALQELIARRMASSNASTAS